VAGNPPPAKGTPPKGGKLSLKSPVTWVIILGVAVAGGAYLLWRRSKATAASSGGSLSSGTATDYSGALGTLQDEIGNLQSSGGGSGGGTSVVPVGGDTSGGAGTVTTTGTGPASGGNSSGSSGGWNSGSSSSGSTSSGSGSSSSGCGSPSGSTSSGGTPGSWTDTGQTWSANQLAAKLGIPESALRGSNRLGEKALGDPNAPIAKTAAFTFLKPA
jgi:hypothetical protein